MHGVSGTPPEEMLDIDRCSRWPATSSGGCSAAPTARARYSSSRRHTAGDVHLLQCWVSEFEALSDMDGNVNLIAIERLQLEHEGVHVRPAG